MITYNEFAKTKPVRSKKYREFVISRGCIIPGCHKKAAPHHENLGEAAMGGKCSDLQCLGLCADHHTIGTMSRHKHPHGWKGFWWSHNIDPAIEIVKMINFFISAGGKF